MNNIWKGTDKGHRGQEGRVLKGQNTRRRCYGYENVPD